MPPFAQLIRGASTGNSGPPSGSRPPPPPPGAHHRQASFNSVSSAPRTGIYNATLNQPTYPSAGPSMAPVAFPSRSPEPLTRTRMDSLDDQDELEGEDEDVSDDHDSDAAPTTSKDATTRGKDGKRSGGGGGGGGSSGVKVKRRRQVQSCSECRRRKIKCDKKFPCGPCVLRNDQSICREVEKHSPVTTGCAPMQEILHLQTRIAALETLLTRSGILDPGALESMLGSKGKLTMLAKGSIGGDGEESNARKVDGRVAARVAGDLGAGDDVDGESDMEGAALTLEHLAFGRRKTEQAVSTTGYGNTIARPDAIRRNTRSENEQRDVTGQQFVSGALLPFSTDDGGLQTGPPGIGSDRPPSRNHAPPLVHGANFEDAGVAPELLPSGRLNLKVNKGPVKSEVLDALAPAEVFSIFYQRSDVFVKALLSVLPERRRGEVLVKSYLERVEWLHRCLHVPTFLRQCEDLWNTPLSHVVTNVYTPFLSLYFIICCVSLLPFAQSLDANVSSQLGLHFMDPAEASEHFTQEEQEALPEIWLTASRGTLWMGDFTAVHTIENLQNIILVGIFLNNRDRADAAWSLLGAAIKMAQGMGLSRLGAEAEPKPGVEPPKWKAPWESLIKREVGRRLWWNLVFLDWSLAPSYNFASTIHPDQIKTALPANVNDEDLIEGQPLRPKPLSERTSMSYHLARLRFAEISQRQIWQANASPHPPYTFILSVDTELRKALNDLPSYFAIDFDHPEAPPTDTTSKIFYWEKIIINLSGQSRLMRLHRPWLSRGYKDPKYEYSRLQCIRAARNCLKLMSDNYGTAVFLERWWIPLFYVTVAAVVVMIDLLRTPASDLENEESRAKQTEVTKALAQIRQVEHISHPARGAIKVIEQLTAELEEKRVGRPAMTGKRKADGEPNAGEDGSGLQRAVKKLILEKHASSPTSTSGPQRTPSVSSAQAVSPSILRSNLPSTTQSSNSNPVFDETAQFLGMFEGQSSNSSSSRPDSDLFPMHVSTAGMVGAANSGVMSMLGGAGAGGPGGSSGPASVPSQSQNDIDFESMLAMYMPSTDIYNPTATNADEPNLTGATSTNNLVFDSQGNIDFGFSGGMNPYRGWIG